MIDFKNRHCAYGTRKGRFVKHTKNLAAVRHRELDGANAQSAFKQIDAVQQSGAECGGGRGVETDTICLIGAGGVKIACGSEPIVQGHFLHPTGRIRISQHTFAVEQADLCNAGGDGLA